MQQIPLNSASKSLHAKYDWITKEPLPKRWVELIHRLNEIEYLKAAAERQAHEAPERR
jgi:hypothetical protein